MTDERRAEIEAMARDAAWALGRQYERALSDREIAAIGFGVRAALDRVRDARGDYELVRVSREMVERFIEDDSNPVVVMRLERLDDGTCEMWLQDAPVVAEAERLRALNAELVEAHNALLVEAARSPQGEDHEETNDERRP